MSKHHKDTGTRIGLYVVYTLTSLFFLYPLLWVVSLSLKTVPELFAVPPKILPQHFAIENYAYVLWKARILKNLWNSLFVVTLTVIGTLIITLPASYAFSRMYFRFKKSLLLCILGFQMISPLVIVIPLYRYFSKINMLNSNFGLIAVYIAVSAPFATWFLKGFLDTIPKELDEAAIIDGCNRLQILRMVLIPVTIPGIISALLLIAIRSWSQFVVPFILLDKGDMFPISVGLVNLQSTTDAISTHYLAAASVLGILPTVVVFILLQKFIVSALTAGAVKG